MQALPFAFLLFISLSIVETKRGSSQKEDEKEIVPVWSGGTTSDNKGKGSTKEVENIVHEILPMHPHTDHESEEQRNGNEIQPMNPNPSSTTPEFTEDEWEDEEDEGNGSEIRPMNPSSTTPGYMRKGSTHRRIMNENYPTWPTVNTPSYIEKGSTRKKSVHKTTTTTAWPTVNTPGYDGSGSTQGNVPDRKPSSKPPARTHGNKEKDCLQGNNGWPGYGGRGCVEGNNTDDKLSSKPSSPPLGRPRYRGRGYGRGKKRPLGEIIVSISGWPGYGGRVFDRGNNTGYKPFKKPSVSFLEWPGYGGRGCSQGTSILLTRLGVILPGWPGLGGKGCGQENNRLLIRPTLSIPGFSGSGECGLTHGLTGLGFGGSGCGQENKRQLIRLPLSLPGFSGFGACEFGGFQGFQFSFGRSPLFRRLFPGC